MARKQSRTIRWAKDTRLDLLPEVMSVEQAARYLGIGRNTAYEAIRRGELPATRIGRRLVVVRAALERRLTQAAATTPTIEQV